MKVRIYRGIQPPPVKKYQQKGSSVDRNRRLFRPNLPSPTPIDDDYLWRTPSPSKKLPPVIEKDPRDDLPDNYNRKYIPEYYEDLKRIKASEERRFVAAKKEYCNEPYFVGPEFDRFYNMSEGDTADKEWLESCGREEFAEMEQIKKDEFEKYKQVNATDWWNTTNDIFNYSIEGIPDLSRREIKQWEKVGISDPEWTSITPLKNFFNGFSDKVKELCPGIDLDMIYKENLGEFKFGKPHPDYEKHPERAFQQWHELQSGQLYQGECDDDTSKPDGKGILITPSEQVAVGNFKQGKFHGPCTILQKKGMMIEFTMQHIAYFFDEEEPSFLKHPGNNTWQLWKGAYRRGKKHGECTVEETPNFERVTEWWEDGVLQTFVDI